MLNARLEPLGNLLSYRFKEQCFSGDPLIDRHDMKTMAGP
jgi:hypothetical protein